jgi:2-polyprenyl-3-methyl-5-hydroxy-6-metoxy-1,4-benzoquinol methylase
VPFPAGSPDTRPAVAAYFNKLYAGVDRYWLRADPRYSADPADYPFSLLTQLTLRQLQGRPPGRALDLGAGEGADSIRLARLGYDVTAVDVSDVAGNKITRFAETAGVKVNVEVGDIGCYEPDGEFDVIICNGVLHYIADNETVIRRVQNATRPGGINVVSTWSTFTPVPDCHNSVAVYCDREDGALARSYTSWHMKLFYFERDKPESAHSGMDAHSHSHIKMIAEKPGGSATVPAGR